MPIVQTANGPVMVDDNAPPEVIARIRAQNAKPVQGRNSTPSGQTPVRVPPGQPVNADQAEIARRVAEQRKTNQSGLFGETGAGILRKVTQGFTFNNMDEIDGALHAATSGVANAVRKGDIHEIGREYRIARDTQRQVEGQQASGPSGTIAEIAGALANPIADGANILKFGGKAVPILAKAGTKLSKARRSYAALQLALTKAR
jgi:hypothetical protein